MKPQKNYVCFLSSQLFGYLAQWLFYFVVSWYVYALTHSAALLGTMALSGLIPTLVFGQLSGLLTDKMDSKKLLNIVQIGFLLHGVLSLSLIFLGCFNLPIIFFLVILHGMISAFDKPIKQVILPSFEKIASIEKIIALNALSLNTARLLSPLLAGFILKKYNISICFLFNFIFIIISAIFTLILQVDRRPIAQNHKRSFKRLFKSQNKYLYQNKKLMILLLLATTLSWTLGPITMLLPVFNGELYAGNSEWLGFLFAASAAGNLLLGIFKLFVVEKQAYQMKSMLTSIFLAVICLFLFALGQNKSLALILLFLSSALQLYALLSINIAIQRLCDKAFRGRVLSLFTLGFVGLTPLSNFLAGILAEIFSAKIAIQVNCFLCLFVCLILIFYGLKKNEDIMNLQKGSC